MPELNAPEQPIAASEAPSIEETMSKVYDEVVEGKEPESKVIAAKDEGTNSENLDQNVQPSEKTEDKSTSLATEATAAPESSQEEQQKARYTEIDNAFAPYREELKRNGVSEGEYIKRVIAAEKYLLDKPYEGLASLAQYAGVDLVQFAQAILQNAGNQSGQKSQSQPANKNNDDAYVDPALQAILGPIQSKVNALETAHQQSLRERKAQEEAKIMADINDFSSKNKHWAKLEQQIVPLVRAIKMNNPRASNQEILKEAYEIAAWRDPEVKAILLNEERAKQVQQANAKTSAAKKAGASVTGSPSGKVQSQPNYGGSIEETMSKIWDERVTKRIQ